MSLLFLFRPHSSSLGAVATRGGIYPEPVTEHQIKKYWEKKRKKIISEIKLIEEQREEEQKPKPKRKSQTSQSITPSIDYSSLLNSLGLIDSLLLDIHLVLEHQKVLDYQAKLLALKQEQEYQAYLHEQELLLLAEIARIKKERQEEEDIIFLAMLH